MGQPNFPLVKKLELNQVVLLLLSVVVLLAVGGALLIFWKNASRPEKPVPRPLTSTLSPLAQGKQIYKIRQSEKEQGPKLKEVVVDPFDPKTGERQTMSIETSYSEPIESAKVTLKTDQGSKIYPLRLVEGTNLDGRWEGSWGTDDTHLVIYDALFEVFSKNKNASVELSFR